MSSHGIGRVATISNAPTGYVLRQTGKLRDGAGDAPPGRWVSLGDNPSMTIVVTYRWPRVVNLGHVRSLAADAHDDPASHRQPA
jgi:hypothetical protein